MAWGNNSAIQQKMQQPGFNPNAGISEAQPRQTGLAGRLARPQQPQGQMTPGNSSMAPSGGMGQMMGQGIQGGMNQRNQMNQGMGQKLGGALGSIFNNPDMMQKIRQGMPGWGMRNPQSPMLPNENRVPMGPGPSYSIGGGNAPNMPMMPGGGGWQDFLKQMPQQGQSWESTLNPNIGGGTGSNSRDSSDWLQRHPEEQKPAWWDSIQNFQPPTDRATTQGPNQLQQVPGANSMQPSAMGSGNPQFANRRY